MTVQQAQEVKDILMQIRGSIPSNLVDPIYNHYKTYINSGFIRPCTCQPKYWNQMIVELRDKVELVLSNQVIENVAEKDIHNQSKKRGGKRILKGSTN